MPRIARVRSIASFSFALPGFERCERPNRAPLSASGVQPGRLAQGPDEKKGRAGRTAGILPVISTFLPECSRRVGAAWPATRIGARAEAVNELDSHNSHRGYANENFRCVRRDFRGLVVHNFLRACRDENR